MTTTIYEGKKVKEIELLNLFPASEGMITQYYGRIGSGKTYSATADVLNLLDRGKVVYTNWRIHYEGTDERKSAFRVLVTILLPWIKRFYVFPKENLHYIEVDKEFHAKFSKLTDCHVFLDEGHVAFDSYEMARMDIEKRKAILHTRHFNRSIHIISQRPSAIHVTMRANVNAFYKCEKIWSFGNIVRFRRTMYQDMLNETVDENDEKITGVKHYWGNKRIFEAYNSQYLRDGLASSQKLMFDAYEFSYWGKLKLLTYDLFPSLLKHIPPKMVQNKVSRVTELSTLPIPLKSVRNIPKGSFSDIIEA